MVGDCRPILDTFENNYLCGFERPPGREYSSADLIRMVRLTTALSNPVQERVKENTVQSQRLTRRLARSLSPRQHRVFKFSVAGPLDFDCLDHSDSKHAGK